MERRHFIKHSSLLATSILTTTEDKQEYKKMLKNDITILATNWGFEGGTAEFCAKASSAGYDGIEVWVPNETKQTSELLEAVKRFGLKLGLLAGGSDKDFSKHKIQFEQAIYKGISMNPIYINCHSGKDYFSFEQNKELIEFTINQSEISKLPIYHETHRGRALFAGHITKQFIDKIDKLKLTLDISHWCNVHESLLSDQPEMINIALSRSEHIHARVGYAEGPQVNDPRAPEWNEALQTHLGWWDKIVERKRREGKPITILTEFGPPSYLQTLPYTKKPVADQWEINVYMMNLLRNRYTNS